MSQLAYFLLLVFSILSSFSMKSDGQGTNSFEETCPSHDCYGVSIRYPFWQLDSTTWQEFCGYPGFGIICSINKYPIIRLPKGEYYVKNINYNNYTFTLVDIDVVDKKCPRVTHNLSVENFPLSTSDLDLNLTFYFNCTSDFPSTGIQIECLASVSKKSYVREQERVDDTNWYEYCEDKVEAAVMEPRNGIDGFVNDSSSAFNEGFLLDWRSFRYCGECEASGGRCGFNNVTKVFLCFCSDGTIKNNKQYCPAGGKLNLGLKIGIGLGVAAITVILLVCLCCLRKFLLNTSVLSWKTKDKYVEAFIRQYGALTPKRYTYSQIKTITNSFKDELGKGGYGNVFKGKLLDGRVVAVKVMKVSRGNGEEFMNEVTSIGRTSHVNVVTLLGFCYEGKKRALLYEFMPNGSLEKFIDGKNPSFAGQHLRWETLYNIALGIARGLEYLHRGCNTRILHFDIKPHNILLDEDFCPKISDFGFAKLSTSKDSKISMMEARGTIGYIAPEVFSRNFGGVSHKSDVYSYGMMVLEMTGGKKNVDAGAGHTSDIYFPRWIYKRIELNEELNLPSAMTAEENEIARKMIVVGLWCIQMDPSQRPSISKVMEMLEGSIAALEIPPPPYLCSSPRSASNSLSEPSLSFSSRLTSNSSLNLASFFDPVSESNSFTT